MTISAKKASLLTAGLAALCLQAVVPGSAVAGPNDYKIAERAFFSLEEKVRYEVALLLITSGDYNGTSTGEFGPRLFKAIRSYQSSIGHPQTGFLTYSELGTLRNRGYSAMSGWGMTEVVHPFTDAKLFVPKRAAPKESYTKRGLAYAAYDDSVSVDYSFFSASENSLEGLYERLGSTAGGRRIDYKVIRPAFFAIAGGVGQRGFYIKYQLARGGIVGFTMSWDSTRVYRGERIAVLMSNLFTAPLTGGYGTPAQVAMPPVYAPPAPPPPAPVQPAPAPVVAIAPSAPPPPAPPAERPQPSGGSGTGFFIASKRMLTNAHVVDGCEVVTVSIGQTKVSGRVLARDKSNDLALIETDTANETTAKLRSGVRLGEEVSAFGFPLNGFLATSGNFTRGGVTATVGLRDDSSQLQISAPVQPGNSGGPLLDESGNVVGVVASKLKVLQVALITGDFAQNVNFAIKSSVAQTFLESHATDFQSGALGDAMKPADLAAHAQAFSGIIECKP